MDASLLIAASASFVAGLLGYIIASMWIKPISRYTMTRRKLDQALTQYLAEMDEIVETGQAAKGKQAHMMLRTARKHAMDLVACYNSDIPYWYRLLLESRKVSPTDAAGLLTNLPKIQDSDQVKKRIASARKVLGLK